MLKPFGMTNDTAQKRFAPVTVPFNYSPRSTYWPMNCCGQCSEFRCGGSQREVRILSSSGKLTPRGDFLIGSLW